MRICDLLDMFSEPESQKIAIFDTNKGDEVFKGFYSEIPSKYSELEIEGIDNIYPETSETQEGCIIINVNIVE